MEYVNTVCGPISADSLGITLMHDHVLYGPTGWYADSTMGAVNKEAVIDSAVKCFNDLKPFGVKTVVDPNPMDTGRDPEIQREVSKRTGINIICSTGYYTEAEGGSSYFKYRARFGYDIEAEIYQMFIKELTEGIGDTGIKAGVIKIASGTGAITDYEKVFFRAAVKAQKETGVPILTHTTGGTMGPEQAELLLAEGADPKRTLIGHMGDNTDIRYQLRTLEKGVYIGFDRMGLQGILGLPWDKERYPLIIGLIGSGYADRIMISHDYAAVWLGREWNKLRSMPETANWYPTHLFKNIIPILKIAGVTDSQINMMLVENPRHLFTGEQAA